MSDKAENLGAGLIIVAMVGVPTYAATVTWFPEHLVPIAVLYALFAIGGILIAWDT